MRNQARGDTLTAALLGVVLVTSSLQLFALAQDFSPSLSSSRTESPDLNNVLHRGQTHLTTLTSTSTIKSTVFPTNYHPLQPPPPAQPVQQSPVPFIPQQYFAFQPQLTTTLTLYVNGENGQLRPVVTTVTVPVYQQHVFHTKVVRSAPTEEEFFQSTPTPVVASSIPVTAATYSDQKPPDILIGTFSDRKHYIDRTNYETMPLSNNLITTLPKNLNFHNSKEDVEIHNREAVVYHRSIQPVLKRQEEISELYGLNQRIQKRQLKQFIGDQVIPQRDFTRLRRPVNQEQVNTINQNKRRQIATARISSSQIKPTPARINTYSSYTPFGIYDMPPPRVPFGYQPHYFPQYNGNRRTPSFDSDKHDSSEPSEEVNEFVLSPQIFGEVIPEREVNAENIQNEILPPVQIVPSLTSHFQSSNFNQRRENVPNQNRGSRRVVRVRPSAKPNGRNSLGLKRIVVTRTSSNALITPFLRNTKSSVIPSASELFMRQPPASASDMVLPSRRKIVRRIRPSVLRKSSVIVRTKAISPTPPILPTPTIKDDSLASKENGRQQIRRIVRLRRPQNEGTQPRGPVNSNENVESLNDLLGDKINFDSNFITPLLSPSVATSSKPAMDTDLNLNIYSTEPLPLTYYTTLTYLTTFVDGDATNYASSHATYSSIGYQTINADIVDIIQKSDGITPLEGNSLIPLGVRERENIKTIVNLESKIKIFNEDVYNGVFITPTSRPLATTVIDQPLKIDSIASLPKTYYTQFTYLYTFYDGLNTRKSFQERTITNTVLDPEAFKTQNFIKNSIDSEGFLTIAPETQSINLGFRDLSSTTTQINLYLKTLIKFDDYRNVMFDKSASSDDPSTLTFEMVQPSSTADAQPTSMLSAISFSAGDSGSLRSPLQLTPSMQNVVSKRLVVTTILSRGQQSRVFSHRPGVRVRVKPRVSKIMHDFTANTETIPSLELFPTPTFISESPLITSESVQHLIPSLESNHELETPSRSRLTVTVRKSSPSNQRTQSRFVLPSRLDITTRSNFYVVTRTKSKEGAGASKRPFTVKVSRRVKPTKIEEEKQVIKETVSEEISTLLPEATPSSNLLITYFTTTTFTFPITVEGQTLLTTLEETNSRIVVGSLPQMIPIPTKTLLDVPSSSVPDILDSQTFFTTYTFFTTLFSGDQPLVTSSMQTITNVLPVIASQKVETPAPPLPTMEISDITKSPDKIWTVTPSYITSTKIITSTSYSTSTLFATIFKESKTTVTPIEEVQTQIFTITETYTIPITPTPSFTIETMQTRSSDIPTSPLFLSSFEMPLPILLTSTFYTTYTKFVTLFPNGLPTTSSIEEIVSNVVTLTLPPTMPSQPIPTITATTTSTTKSAISSKPATIDTFIITKTIPYTQTHSITLFKGDQTVLSSFEVTTTTTTVETLYGKSEDIFPSKPILISPTSDLVMPFESTSQPLEPIDLVPSLKTMLSTMTYYTTFYSDTSSIVASHEEIATSYITVFVPPQSISSQETITKTTEEEHATSSSTLKTYQTASSELPSPAKTTTLKAPEIKPSVIEPSFVTLTKFATYTLFTTLFQGETPVIISSEHVVPEIVTTTLDSSSSTTSFTPTPTSIFIPSFSSSPGEVVLTFKTTYTFFTTLFSGDSLSITSSESVVTQYVTREATSSELESHHSATVAPYEGISTSPTSNIFTPTSSETSFDTISPSKSSSFEDESTSEDFFKNFETRTIFIDGLERTYYVPKSTSSTTSEETISMTETFSTVSLPSSVFPSSQSESTSPVQSLVNILLESSLLASTATEVTNVPSSVAFEENLSTKLFDNVRTISDDYFISSILQNLNVKSSLTSIPETKSTQTTTFLEPSVAFTPETLRSSYEISELTESSTQNEATQSFFPTSTQSLQTSSMSVSPGHSVVDLSDILSGHTAIGGNIEVAIKSILGKIKINNESKYMDVPTSESVPEIVTPSVASSLPELKEVSAITTTEELRTSSPFEISSNITPVPESNEPSLSSIVNSIQFREEITEEKKQSTLLSSPLLKELISSSISPLTSSTFTQDFHLYYIPSSSFTAPVYPSDNVQSSSTTESKSKLASTSSVKIPDVSLTPPLGDQTSTSKVKTTLETSIITGMKTIFFSALDNPVLPTFKEDIGTEASTSSSSQSTSSFMSEISLSTSFSDVAQPTLKNHLYDYPSLKSSLPSSESSLVNENLVGRAVFLDPQQNYSTYLTNGLTVVNQTKSGATTIFFTSLGEPIDRTSTSTPATRYVTSSEESTRTLTLTSTRVFYTRDSPITITSLYTTTILPRTFISTIIGTRTILGLYSSYKPKTTRYSTTQSQDPYYYTGIFNTIAPSTTTFLSDMTTLVSAGTEKPPSPPESADSRSSDNLSIKRVGKARLEFAGAGPTSVQMDSGKSRPCLLKCDTQNHEVCAYVNGRMTCSCAKGFERRGGETICRPIETYVLWLRIDRPGNGTLPLQYTQVAQAVEVGVEELYRLTSIQDNLVRVSLEAMEPPSENADGILLNMTLRVTRDAGLNEMLLEQELIQALRVTDLRLGNQQLSVTSGGRSAYIRDLDECRTEPPRHDCGENALCLNLPGHYTCQCNQGYVDLDPTQPGRHCTDEVKNCDFCYGRGDCDVDAGHRVCRCHDWNFGRRCQINGLVLMIAVPTGATLLFLVLLCLCCCRKEPSPKPLMYPPPTPIHGSTLDRKKMIPDDNSSNGSEERPSSFRDQVTNGGSGGRKPGSRRSEISLDRSMSTGYSNPQMMRRGQNNGVKPW